MNRNTFIQNQIIKGGDYILQYNLNTLFNTKLYLLSGRYDLTVKQREKLFTYIDDTIKNIHQNVKVNNENHDKRISLNIFKRIHHTNKNLP